jgi:hypothetical protein
MTIRCDTHMIIEIAPWIENYSGYKALKWLSVDPDLEAKRLLTYTGERQQLRPLANAHYQPGDTSSVAPATSS